MLAQAVLLPAVEHLARAGARHIEITEHKERLTGGNWLFAVVLWKHKRYQLDTAKIAYESWTENVVAMAGLMFVLAAQLRTKRP